MKPRLNPYQAAPGVMKAMIALEAQVASSGLEPALIELVKIRASQINGCAFCLHMHTRDARTQGEREERLSARRLARIAALQQARAGGARLDRGGDAGGPNPCAGRGL